MNVKKERGRSRLGAKVATKIVINLWSIERGVIEFLQTGPISTAGHHLNLASMFNKRVIDSSHAFIVFALF